ncbi:MAG: hypothetical protein K2Y22_04410 [Candidatus Obscuribacterales bacterium]|nr:hypothetical protein [Candidatus Obscuribacterales bacterium]
MSILVQDMQPDRYAMAKCNLVIQIQPGFDLTVVGCRLINKNGNMFVAMPQIQWQRQDGQTGRMNTVKLSEQLQAAVRQAVVAEYQRLNGGQMQQQQPAQQNQGFAGQAQGFGNGQQNPGGFANQNQNQGFGQQPMQPQGNNFAGNGGFGGRSVF